MTEDFGTQTKKVGQQTANDAVHVARDAKARASNFVGEVGLADQARSAGRSGSDMLGRVMKSPMILGAIGLGVGAVLAGLVPRTDAETQALGRFTGDARDTFRETSQEGFDRGSNAARKAIGVARSTFEDYGLAGSKDLGDLAEDAGENKLGGQAAEVARSALAAANDDLNQRDGSKA